MTTTLSEAIERVTRAAGRPRAEAEVLPLARAVGRVLLEDAVLEEPLPAFARASMDGFAVGSGVRAGERLRVRGRIVAGEWPDGPLPAGDAVRIMTGAPVPEGAARVIPVEWTRPVETDPGTGGGAGKGSGGGAAGGADVFVLRLPDAVPYVVPAGAHGQPGEVIVSRGTRLGPGHVSALAALGLTEVQVARRPRVAVLGTGSELVAADAQPRPGQVRNSNGPMLAAAARAAGAEVEELGLAPDDLLTLRRRIRDGLAADVLLLSGGVSRGDLDLVPDALEAEGVEPVFHHWAVQPGGPLWFGREGSTLVFGLPGNPAASFVGFHLLVVPALATREGRPFAPRPILRARYRGPWGSPSPRRRFRPVSLETTEDGTLLAVAGRWTGSGDPFLAARTPALAALPECVAAPPADAGLPVVDVIPLEPFA